MDDIVIEQILYKFFYHTTYMADANQETKKDSKIKKRYIVDGLELVLFGTTGFLFGIIGGLIILTPFFIIVYFIRRYGNEKIELIFIILYSFFVVILYTMLASYLKSIYSWEYIIYKL